MKTFNLQLPPYPMPEPPAHFRWHQRMLWRMDYLGMNNAELARRTHCHRNNIYTIARGQSNGGARLPLIARALGVSCDWLWGLTTIPEPYPYRAQQSEIERCQEKS